MRNGKQLEYPENRYNEIKKRLLENNRMFSEQVFGGRKTIYLNNQITATTVADAGLITGDITKRQFTAFLGMFNRVLYQRFNKKPELLNLKIDFKGVSRKKNNDLWTKSNYGTLFYNLDLSSAYWQMAFRLGYISENVYLNYIDKDEYKEVKRYCVSFLARVNQKKYVSNTGEQYIIKCDMTVLQTVYDNIRNELYKTITEVSDNFSDVLEQNIDGLTVLYADYKKAKSLLTKKGLKFKVTQCIKINDYQYLYNNKPRFFKKPPKNYVNN